MKKILKPVEGVEQFNHKAKCLLCNKSVFVYAKIQGSLYESCYQCNKCDLCSTNSCILKETKGKKNETK